MTLRRVAFWAACLAVPLGLVSDALYVAAEGFRPDPAAMVRLDVLAADPALLRWAAFTDFASFYVPLVPVALYLRGRFASRDPLVDLYAVAAIAFAVVGGAAALALGAVGPALAAANATAGPAAAPAYAVAARALEDTVFVAIWQTCGASALGIFFVGISRLIRPEHRSLGTLTLVIGGDAFLVAAARVTGLEPVAIVTVVVWLPLMTIWFGWLALAALREGRPELARAA
ncbi:MAG TPA: hypothetical protein VLI88_00500 [Patescibacteria group bacterium]|nr:hypothetical protein [Patescibacteria group bacterium]